MNSLRLLLGIFALLPFAIAISYFLPFNFVEGCVIAVLAVGLLAAPVLLLVFAITATLSGLSGGVRRR